MTEVDDVAMWPTEFVNIPLHLHTYRLAFKKGISKYYFNSKMALSNSWDGIELTAIHINYNMCWRVKFCKIS